MDELFKENDLSAFNKPDLQQGVNHLKESLSLLEGVSSNALLFEAVESMISITKNLILFSINNFGNILNQDEINKLAGVFSAVLAINETLASELNTKKGITILHCLQTLYKDAYSIVSSRLAYEFNPIYNHNHEDW